MKRVLTACIGLLLALTIAGCSTSDGPVEVSRIRDQSEQSYLSSESDQSSPSSTDASAPAHSTSKTEVEESTSDGSLLSKEQRNSLAMLNYLSVVSQSIDSSKNNRGLLETYYSALINNTRPDKISPATEEYLSQFLDVIEKFRMVDRKRERLNYNQDQKQAKKLAEIVPEPMEIINKVIGHDWVGLLADAIKTGINIIDENVVNNDSKELAQDFLRSNWELEDEEAEAIHQNRKLLFLYMIDIIRENNIPAEYSLNENSVKEFVEWSNRTNVDQKVHFLESSVVTYKNYGPYWLELTRDYYEQRDYGKSLEAFYKFETLKAEIFRKDYELARTIPTALASACYVLSNEEYIPKAEKYLQLLMDNTDSSDWANHYFASQSYIDLYARTDNEIYLRKAYDITLADVNYLSATQHQSDLTYLSDVKPVTLSANASDQEKKEVDSYNKWLVENRKTELPPVYEPLRLNLDLLFALAEKLNIDSSEKNKIERILRGSDALFITDSLEQQYSFLSTPAKSYTAVYDKTKMVLPLASLSEDSYIKATVLTNGESKEYTDWSVKEVDRSSGSFQDYNAVLESEDIDEQEWDDSSTIKVEVFSKKDSSENPVVLEFKVSNLIKVPFTGWILDIDFEQIGIKVGAS